MCIKALILMITLSVARSPSSIPNLALEEFRRSSQKKRDKGHINAKIMLKVLCCAAPLLITRFLSSCVVLAGPRSSTICRLDCY
jgi:hypothetical protein